MLASKAVLCVLLLALCGCFAQEDDPPPFREYISFDGWYHNLAHPEWGAVDRPLHRYSIPEYYDGAGEPSGWDRPNPRDISEAVMRGPFGFGSSQNRTALMVFFGQQVVEEILDAQRQGCIPEYLNIPINETDPLYGGIYYKFIPLTRSRYAMPTGQAPGNPRAQFNEISPWFDGTLMYGPNKAWCDVLRAYKDGLLAENPDTPGYPPDNHVGLPIANPPVAYTHKLANAKRFMVFGNPRTNENPMMLSMATLWYRNHNWHARRLKAEHPTWNDEVLFLEARKWNVADHQHMVLDEWLPRWLGVPVPAYTGYKAYIIPTISQEFQTAAMRFGHTLVTPGVYRRDANCVFYNTTSKTDNNPNKIALRTCNTFFRGREYLQETEDGWERIIQGMASTIAEREDAIITEDLRGFVFGPLEASRRDLMAINIQRGREHGMTDYNTVRKAFGLAPRTSFAEINPGNLTIGENIERIYNGDINKIDLWVGGIGETTAQGPGETFRTILLDQFTRIRDGDRFWFENTGNGYFNATELATIKSLNMNTLIMRNHDPRFPVRIQADPFFFSSATDSAFCPQPKQLSPGDLEECSPPKTFDYFDTSGGDFFFILFFGCAGWVFVNVIVCYNVMTSCARKGATRERNLAKQRSRSVRQSVPPRDDANTMSYGAVMYDGAHVEPVYLNHDDNHLVISTKGRNVIREVDFARIMDMSWSDCVLLIRVPSEYDVLLSFGEPSRAHTYMGVLHNDIRAGLNKSVTATEASAGTEGLFAVARSHDDHTMRLNAFVGFALRKIMSSGITVGDQLPISANEAALYRDAAKFTMSQDTFAEAFQMPRNSLFVQRIFELADRDASGTITFNEFVDVMAVLCNGSPTQKMRLLFEMYDVDHNGTLDMGELRTIVRSTLEMTNLVENTESRIEQVLKSMIETAGFSMSQQTFDFNAFQRIMGAEDGVASRFGLKPSAVNARFGDDAPTVALSSNPKDARIAESATDDVDGPEADANVTPLSGLVRGYTTKNTARRATMLAGNKPLAAVTDKPVKLSTWQRAHRWIRERRLGVFWTWVITIATLGTFAERAYSYSFEREAGGLRSIAGYGVTVTRGAASSIMFRSSVLLLPVCRNAITWARGTVLNRIIPFDAAIGFHKVNAIGAGLFIIMHIVGHCFNFYCISTQPPPDAACLFREVSWESDFLPSLHWWVFHTVTGVTGYMVTLVTFTIFLFAMPFARRINFNMFWYTHNLYPLYYFLIVVHGAAQLVQLPIFWLYGLGPGCLFVVDKLASYVTQSREIQVVNAEILPAGVLRLQFHRPKDFKFISGHWARIRCNAVSSFENHPFTITSAPHDKYLEVYIRACGPWTSKIYDVYKAAVDNGDDLPTINVDGPYGESYQQWSNFHVSILIGGGIGVTPFVSIIRDYLHQCKFNEDLIVKKMYFLWICRTQKQFEWVIDVLRELEESDQNGNLEVHVFITELNQNFDLRTSLLYICERQFHKVNDCSLFTGLQAPTHFGRPKFESIIRQIMFRHTEEQIIAVFSCGSVVMTSGVFEAIDRIRATPRPEDPVLNHKSLNF